jgi:hypothetical protein
VFEGKTAFSRAHTIAENKRKRDEAKALQAADVILKETPKDSAWRETMESIIATRNKTLQ